MLAATYRLLGEAGYLKGEERIDRDRLGDAIVVLLLTQPVDQADDEEIAAKAKTVPEIRHSIFNGNGYSEEVEKELDVLVSQIAAGDGKVQDKLDIAGEGRFVLCSKRITRQVLSMDGQQTMTLTRSGKFVSNDPDVIDRFYYADAIARATGSLKKVRSRLNRAEKRQPLLAARRLALTRAVHETVQLELPMEAASE